MMTRPYPKFSPLIWMLFGLIPSLSAQDPLALYANFDTSPLGTVTPNREAIESVHEGLVTSFTSGAGRASAGMAFRSTATADLRFALTDLSNVSLVDLTSGTVQFWFCPEWTSNAPEAPEEAILLSLGNLSIASEQDKAPGFWGLVLEEKGTRIRFVTRLATSAIIEEHFNWSNTETRDIFDGKAPVSFNADTWYKIQLDFGPRHRVPYNNSNNESQVFTASQLWIDNTRIASGDGVDPQRLPSPNAVEQGLAVGNQLAGGLASIARFDELRIYNRRMAWDLASTNYLWAPTIDLSEPSVTLIRHNEPSPVDLIPVDIFRRAGTVEAAWGEKIATNVSGSTFKDSSTELRRGQLYEYRIQPSEFQQPDVDFDLIRKPNEEQIVYAPVGLAVDPVPEQGKAILLIETGLETVLATELAQYTSDLRGDGWTVVQHVVARHRDELDCPSGNCGDADWALNATEIQRIKTDILANEYDANRRCVVVLVGHVPIPRSGGLSMDGHSSHNGAWPADGYYGSLSSAAPHWTDLETWSNANLALDNVPGDGKFDQNSLPSDIVMAVGRLDFTALPAFAEAPYLAGQPFDVNTDSGRKELEVALLKNYFDKNHRYRHDRLEATLEVHYHRGFVEGSFLGYDGAFRARNLAGALRGLDRIGSVVDFPLFSDKAILFGIHEDFGQSVGHRYAFVNPNELAHRTADFADPMNEPKVAFFLATGSFFGDFVLTDDNYLRGLLSIPNYGLAAMFGSRRWHHELMSLGLPLEAGMRRLVSLPTIKEFDFVNYASDRSISFTILGDPTLRAHRTTPPASMTTAIGAGTVTIQWTYTAGSEPTVGGTHVFRSDSGKSGLFKRITVGSPLTTNTFTENHTTNGNTVYQVKAYELLTTGSGSYWNTSQGIFSDSN